MTPPAKDTRADAERSFERLYRGHRADVFRAALRELGNVHDAEDVTQAAFVDAYRAVLRGTRPEAPRAWLLTIAENVRRRRFRTTLRHPREVPLDADAAFAAEESREQASALLDALARLTAEQREAFLLREITGLSYAEIAQRMDSTVGSVQMLLFRARATLRDELEPPQRHGAFLPLATVLSRFEPFGLTPRAVGAVGAAALALGVSASVPAHADRPPATAAVVPVTAPAFITAAQAKQVPAPPKTAPATRRFEASAPAAVAAPPVLRPVVAAPAPQPQPPEPQNEPEPQPATPPALALPAPPVPLPSLPLPSLLDPLVEPLLEGAGAAGAPWSGDPPLPVLPLDPLPPVP
jgi:RNA polymerase sigma-70 factor (ECF subfamily)